MLDLLVPLLIGAVVVLLAAAGAFGAVAARTIGGGHRVTVSLTDGSVLSGRTRATWPGRVRLVDVETNEGEVPGTVLISSRHVVTVQVIS